MAIHAVILCGGRGERFWPKSRRSQPKQFIKLFGPKSLTRQTSDRIAPLCPVKRQLFVLPIEFRSMLRSEGFRENNMLCEPVGRNTAPAIGLAALHLHKQDPDAVMVVLPADHLIEDRAAFLAAVRLAAVLAEQGRLVTFGIRPSRPDTGYGYIQVGRRIAGKAGLTGHEVRGFREKPDLATAKRYVASDNFLWNSGMFVWRADVILDAFRKYLPEFHARLAAFRPHIGREEEKRELDKLYRAAPSVSIDYAVMEKAGNVAAVRSGFDWDDVGSWLALERHSRPDSSGNIIVGRAVARGSRNCILDVDRGLVALLGVKDLVVVRSGDALLVAHKSALGDIKRLLASLAGYKEGRKLL